KRMRPQARRRSAPPWEGPIEPNAKRAGEAFDRALTEHVSIVRRARGHPPYRDESSARWNRCISLVLNVTNDNEACTGAGAVLTGGHGGNEESGQTKVGAPTHGRLRGSLW